MGQSRDWPRSPARLGEAGCQLRSQTGAWPHGLTGARTELGNHGLARWWQKRWCPGLHFSTASPRGSLTSMGVPFHLKEWLLHPALHHTTLGVTAHITIPAGGSASLGGHGQGQLKKVLWAQNMKPTPKGLLCCLPTVPPWTCASRSEPFPTVCVFPVPQGSAPSPAPGCLP